MSDEHKRIFLTPKCMQEHECERMWCEDPQDCDECDSPAVEYALASERDTALAEAAALRRELERASLILVGDGNSIICVACAEECPTGSAVPFPHADHCIIVSKSPAQELLDKMGRMREALMPFAERAAEIDRLLSDDARVYVNVGDLRRAAAVEK